MPDTHVLAEHSSQRQLAVYNAIVIGAGISGLYMLYRLRELGLFFFQGADAGMGRKEHFSPSPTRWNILITSSEVGVPNGADRDPSLQWF